MPDFTTHHIFGQQVLAATNEGIRQEIQAGQGGYYWGLQGPDLLFFHRAVRADSPLPNYGRLMHKERTALLFARLVQSVVDDRKCLDFDTVRGYYYGFCCHYALDSSVHPYVFSRQRELQAGREYGDNRVHWQIEAGIDNELYALLYHDDIRRFRVSEHYRIQKEDKNSIARLLSKLLRSVYGVDVLPRELMACFDDAVWINRILYDPCHVMKPTARVVEKIIGRDEQLTSHFKGGDVCRDYLNLEHRPWPHIAEGEAIHTESVPELMEIAKERALILIEQGHEAMRRGDWKSINRIDLTENFIYGIFEV